jgi:amino acid transporter
MNTFTISLKYGAIGGTVVLIYSQLVSRIGMHYDEELIFYFGYLGILIMPIFTFLAIRKVSGRYEQHRIPFFKALITGLLVAVVAAFTYYFLHQAENQLFPDKYRSYLIEKTIEEMQQQGNTPEEIDARVGKIQEHYNSWRPLRNSLKWYTMLGTVYSVLSYFILNYFNKKKLR